MTKSLVCARPGCGQSFVRIKCQRYCNVACRKADRKCCRCRISLPVEQSGTKNAYCRPCEAELRRVSRGSFEDQSRVMDAYRFKKFGLSPEGYLAMLEKQQGLCAVCGKPETAKSRSAGRATKALAVDHDHETGKIRGLLCQRCNTALGLLREDEGIVQSLLAYLRLSQSITVHDVSIRPIVGI